MEKIKVKTIGRNGNIFNIVGKVSKALEKNAQKKEALEMRNRVFESRSYEEALMAILDYVELDYVEIV